MNILFVSLGCDKNLVDTEHMLSLLVKDGFTLTDDESLADIIIINSCCFIHDAMEESIQTILDLAKYKETGSLKALLVAGCLAQRFADEMSDELPEVDGIIGTNAYDEIVSIVHQALAGKEPKVIRSFDSLCDDTNGRIVTTGGHFAYLKIADGCDKHCTYCIIPSIRGNYRSYPMEQLITEAKELVSNGVRELILVAQETTLYGIDLYGSKKIVTLLDRLNEIEDLKWIRLLYCYPEEIDDEFIAAMKRNTKVLPYIDMPIQHCNNSLLAKMGRKTSKEDIEKIICNLRTEIPNITIRTTLICGFPGETQAMHRELLSFIKEMHFDRLGAFPYSQEENTPAASFEHQVLEKTKNIWYQEVMEVQQTISLANQNKFIGQTLEAFIEGKIADEDVYLARTYRDAPNVDGYVFIHTTTDFISGDFVTVKITQCNEYDLIGEIVS